MSNNMFNSKFLEKENIETLWDVISDEEIFKFLSRDIQIKILDLFLNNIKGFFDTEKQKTANLMDMNKKYILLVLNHIRKTYPKEMPNKIKIFEETPVKELITYEEIHNEKKTQFEKDFQKRQDDFTNSMKLQVPQVPEFSDNYKDEPISEMDKIIKEMTAKRNYEVEQINRNYQTTVENADNWLKPQETSIKSEKLIPQKQPENMVITNNKFKFLNIEDENVKIETKKNVSWGENNEISPLNLYDEIDESIFKKLKKIEQPNVNNNINNNDLNKIKISVNEYSLEERILNIENELKTYNKKFDTIIELLKENKK